MQSNWDNDLTSEDKLAVFMDEYFYSKLKKEGKIKDYSRRRYSRSEAEEKEQFQGIDRTVEMEGDKALIDDKAALDYVNKPLETFAFEIDYVKDGNLRTGWYVDDSHKTTVYSLMYPDVEPGYEKKISTSSPEIFTSVLTIFVKRKKIDEYLSKYRYTADRLLDYAKRIREEYNEGDTSKNKNWNLRYEHLRLLLSAKKPEKPVLLLIPKEKLRSLADKVVTVTKDRYTIET